MFNRSDTGRLERRPELEWNLCNLASTLLVSSAVGLSNFETNYPSQIFVCGVGVHEIVFGLKETVTLYSFWDTACVLRPADPLERAFSEFFSNKK